MFSVKRWLCVIVAFGNGLPPAFARNRLVADDVPRSTYRYSTFAVQFAANIHSMPPPTVQPTRVFVTPEVLQPGTAAVAPKQSWSLKVTLASARPPVA